MHEVPFHSLKIVVKFEFGPRLFPGEDYTLDPFQWDFVGKNISFMAVEGFVYFILNLLIQYRFFLDHW